MLYRILLPLFALSAFAQAQSNAVVPLPSDLAAKAEQSALLDLDSQGDTLVAVGDRGHIFTLSNGQWQQAKVPVNTLLTAVSLGNDKRGWAVGHDVTILATNNGGQQWQLQQFLPNQDKPLLDVIRLSNQEVIAVGAYGLFYRSTDGGQSWRQEFHDELLIEDDRLWLEDLRAEDEALYLDERSAILPHFNRIKRLANGDLFLIGEMGFMARSSDGGHRWQRLEEIYFGSFLDLIQLDANSLLVIGLRGNAFISGDLGQSWNPVDLDTELTLNGGLRLEDGRIVLVANGGAIFVSDDNGQSFRSEVIATGDDLVSLVAQGNELIIGGSAGFVRHRLTP